MATATISKAGVTIGMGNLTVSDKVYDTTTNTYTTGNATATVQLGNANNANGALNSSTSFAGAVNSTAAFVNASASTGEVAVAGIVITPARTNVNITNSLAASADTANYTITSGSVLTTSATISKAGVVITDPGAVATKAYDGSTSATVSSNATGYAFMGNASLPNGATNNVSFSGLNTNGVFVNPGCGTQNVNLTSTLKDAANYTFVPGQNFVGTLLAPNTVVGNASTTGVITNLTAPATNDGLYGITKGLVPDTPVNKAEAAAALQTIFQAAQPINNDSKMLSSPGSMVLHDDMPTLMIHVAGLKVPVGAVPQQQTVLGGDGGSFGFGSAATGNGTVASPGSTGSGNVTGTGQTFVPIGLVPDGEPSVLGCRAAVRLPTGEDPIQVCSPVSSV